LTGQVIGEPSRIIENLFASVDSNGDGYISEEEYLEEYLHNHHMQEWFEMLIKEVKTG